MQTNEQIEPAVNHRVSFQSVLSWLTIVGFPCLAEFPLIRAYWFGQSAVSNSWRVIVLPFLVLFPGIVGFVFRVGIAQKKGQIDPSTHRWLNRSLESVVMISYLVIGILTSELTRAALR